MKEVQAQGFEPARKLLIFVYLAVTAAYFAWRLNTFNPQAIAFSVLLYVVEIYSVVTVLLHLFMMWKLTERVPTAPPTGLSVDVLIPTLNEPVSMLRRTALAAIQMDYPHQTWLLDDGNRPEVAALARELDCRYLARTSNQDAKAGNLNNALLSSEAEFVAIFDADHVPKRGFLMRLLGYFGDARVAFVQTPQDFYNLDSYEHRWQRPARAVWTEESLFYRVIQRGKDYWNASFFCGSCAVIRRQALNEIGGFARGSITEDLHTSLRLHKRGWHAVYHAEPLAFGLAPAEVGPFLAQRVRWGRGAMQVWRKEGILFAHGLTFPQRLNYLASVLTYFDGWQKGIFYIAPVIVLTTGVMPVRALGLPFLAHFVPYYVLTFWVFEEMGRGYGRPLMIEQYNMAKFAAFCWATFGLFKDTLRFTVTRKVGMGRESSSRYLIPQYGVLVLSALAIPFGIVQYARHVLPLYGLLANIVWATTNGLLGLAVVLFTLRRSQRREEYRFPIPLPVLVQDGLGPATYGVADDISSDGLRLYVRAQEDPVLGQKLTGEIYLPGGPLPFESIVAAKTSSVDAHMPYTKALGCRFIWASSAQRDQLEIFLYGSDLQWQLGQLRDRSPTPLERLRVLKTRAWTLTHTPSDYWAPIVYEITDERRGPEVGLISVLSNEDTGRGERTILLFRPVTVGAALRLIVFSRTGQQMLSGWTLGEERLQNADSSVCVYSFHSYHDDSEHPFVYPGPIGAPRQVVGGGSLLLAVALVGAWVGAAPRAACAQDLLLAGAQVSGPGAAYGYLGFLGPLPGSTLGAGFVQRYWLDAVQYRYLEAGETVQATAPGGEVALGYVSAKGRGHYGFYLGVGYRHTQLVPDVPSAAVRGSQWSLDPQLQADYQVTPGLLVNGIASYAVGPNGYWARVRVLRRIPGKEWLGPEFVLEGNKDYRALQAGLVAVGWHPVPGVVLGVSGGIRFPGGGSKDSAYLGAELTRAF